MSAPKPLHSAAILAIGDELIGGVHADLNSPFLAAELQKLGWRVSEVRVMADEEEALARCMRELVERNDLVLCSGGLGPTLDDVTRHAAARAASLPLEASSEALAEIARWFADSGRAMPRSNDRQALLPLGAEVLPNACGTAPGFRVAIGAARLCALPGPPRELQDMFERQLRAWIQRQWPEARAAQRRCFHMIGLSESLFADRAGAWMLRSSEELIEFEPLMGVTAKAGTLSVHLSTSAANDERASLCFERRIEEFRERFREEIFSEGEADPGLVLAQRLIEGSISVTTAESCTAGMVAAALTRAPGVSAVLSEAFVTYSNEAKTRALGVPPELLAEHGAVSLPVARAMAAGAAQRSGARLALAVTGIAGPDGGTPEKPVGTVCFATCFDGELRDGLRRFPPAGRESIRGWATTWALGLGLQAICARPASSV